MHDGMDGMNETSGASPSVSHLPTVYQDTQRDHATDQDGASAAAPGMRPWRPAMNRWLLTLNSGRTQDEYAKAVRYFFETPGVPQDLAQLSYDLLLAYRGALTLRADRRRRSMPRRAATSSGRLGARPSGPWTMSALPGMTSASEDAQRPRVTPASMRTGPLSPATVNIRLTALRQFLCFVIDQDPLPSLSAERIHSALRRMRNERRRPYQILAEDEWGEFLDVALHVGQAAAEASAPDTQRSPTQPTAPAITRVRSPWGMTSAAREQARQKHAEDADFEHDGEATSGPSADSGEDADRPDAVDVRSRDGRTGARTAQRDHALISLALSTGLRAIELSLLEVGDIVSERRRGQTEWWLSLPDEKTKGQRGGRALPLAPELVATLLAYIRATGRAWENPDHRASPLFLALARGRPAQMDEAQLRTVMVHGHEPERRYRRLRPEQIRSVIHRVEAQWLAQRRTSSDDPAETAEARRISPHTLRHSAAIALLLGDEESERPPASVEHVRGWLGHFDIRTTQRYLAHIESRDQRRRFAIRPHTRNAANGSPDDSEQTT